MKRIVEIMPARPGWYARWRLPDTTRSYPVTLWVLLAETDDETSREVVGMDSAGRWPGSADGTPDARFIRYLFQAPDDGEPDDADPADRDLARHVAAVPGEPVAGAG